MKALKTMFVVAAFGGVLSAGPAFAQATGTQPPATPPAAGDPQAQPPKPQAPAATAPAPQAQPPKPFPEGAKYAFVDIQIVASTSAEGKAATAKLDELKKKKNAELVAKGNTLKASQDKLQSGGGVLSDSARSQLEKDIERMQREIQFAQQDAQSEVQELTDQLQGEFQVKLNPVIEALRVEKGLQMIFSLRDSGIIAADPGLDLSTEIVKRFDAAAKTAPKK
jgi:outer membrane protein